MNEEQLEYEDKMIAFRNEALKDELTMAILVESRDDIGFWKKLFGHFKPQNNFLFCAGVQSKNNKTTFGTGQMLKFHEYKLLNKGFTICIDSDYRYVDGQKNISIKNCIFQTYTHSKENFHCYPIEMENIFGEYSEISQKFIDFEKRMCEISKLTYTLFLFLLYSLSQNDNYLKIEDFHKTLKDLDLYKIKPKWNDIQEKINILVKEARGNYSDISIQQIEKKFEGIGINETNVYMFFRGHNLYEDIVSKLVNQVGNKIIKQLEEKDRGNVPKFSDKLKNRLVFGNYFPLDKIQADINQFFS